MNRELPESLIKAPAGPEYLGVCVGRLFGRGELYQTLSRLMNAIYDGHEFDIKIYDGKDTNDYCAKVMMQAGAVALNPVLLVAGAVAYGACKVVDATKKAQFDSKNKTTILRTCPVLMEDRLELHTFFSRFARDFRAKSFRWTITMLERIEQLERLESPNENQVHFKVRNLRDREVHLQVTKGSGTRPEIAIRCGQHSLVINSSQGVPPLAAERMSAPIIARQEPELLRRSTNSVDKSSSREGRR